VIGPGFLDQRDPVGGGIAFDVVLDRRQAGPLQHRGEIVHVLAPDVPFIGTRVNGDPLCAGVDHAARGLDHAGIGHVALVS
jgi:hypothetical protein